VDAVMGFYADYIETFDEIEIVPERFLESGDAVIVPNRARLRGRDGIETGARSALVFEVRDGLITRLRMYQGEDEALEALGVER
jgi:ketosteroid isomerase-like protein